MSKEKLADYFDSVVQKDSEKAFEAFSQYIEEKGKSVLKELMDEVKKPIRLKGNDVLVKGKKVGTVSHDVEKKDGEESGIEYTCDTSGKKSKHDKLANLFQALAKEHKLEESDLAHLGSTEQVSKVTKAIKDADPKKGVHLSKEAGHEDNVDHSDGEKEHAAAEKKKNESRKQAEKAEKPFRKIKWKE